MKLGTPIVAIGSVPHEVRHEGASNEVGHIAGNYLSGLPALSALRLTGSVAVPMSAEELLALVQPRSESGAPHPPAGGVSPGLASLLAQSRPPIAALPHTYRPDPGSSAEEMAFGLTKTLLDALPPGLDLPPAIDAVGALIAGVDLAKGCPDARTTGEKVLVYSSDVLDIASFVANVSGLSGVGTQLSVVGFVLKSGQQIHSFAVTPQAPR